LTYLIRVQERITQTDRQTDIRIITMTIPRYALLCFAR